MLELIYKNFKTGVINMFKVLKENMVIISKQIGNLGKETEAIKRNKWKFQK